MTENACIAILWGSQSWLQPAFSRLGRAGKRVRRQDCLPHARSVAMIESAVA
jgi:hypothetical protein